MSTLLKLGALIAGYYFFRAVFVTLVAEHLDEVLFKVISKSTEVDHD